MKKPLTIYTPYTEYKNTYTGSYLNYYQIHIYSMEEVISTYYLPEATTLENVKNAAKSILKAIKERSSRNDQITLFQKNGKFLIAEYSELIDPGDVMYFDEERVRYDNSEDYTSSDYFLKDIKIDDFIKNSFITIGAEDLFEEVEPFVQQMRENNDAWEAENEKLRKLNKTDPKLTLEIYRIEIDYKPVLKSSFPLHSERAMFLPEHFSVIKSDERITYLLKDIETGKIIDGDLEDAIHSIKHAKWTRKNPSVISFEALQRMELDNDDPDFLSYDDYVANDEEYEEGDDEFSPG